MLLTLQQIRDQSPCKEGWETLLKSIPGYTMETTVSLGDVAKSNGAQDALWCIRCGKFTKEDIEKALAPLVSRASSRAASRTASFAAYAASDAASFASRAASRAASYASDAASYAASYASDAASYAASRAADAASYASSRAAAEKEQQVLDIIAVWPLTR